MYNETLECVDKELVSHAQVIGFRKIADKHKHYDDKGDVGSCHVTLVAYIIQFLAFIIPIIYIGNHDKQ